MDDKVHTVLGPIHSSAIGITLTHEHLSHSLHRRVFKTPPPAVLLPSIDTNSINLQNLCWIRQYPYSFDINLSFDGDDVYSAVKEDMDFFRSVGGKTIVENSSVGLRTASHALLLKDLSMQTDINIVMGTGFYVASSHDQEVLKYSGEDMELMMKRDILQGVGETGIKCGVIGELGCSWPLLPFEKQVLVSSAAVQEEVRCPVIIHPGRNKDAPGEILRVFLEAGGKASKTVMSHLDRTFTTNEQFAEFASNGTFSELDLFGVEVSHYQPNDDIDMPSDAQRISFVHHLIEAGYEDKILISHDIHTKHRLMKYGGHGYSHIIVNVVPKMIRRGIKSSVMKKLLVENPCSWLCMP